MTMPQRTLLLLVPVAIRTVCAPTLESYLDKRTSVYTSARLSESR